MNRGVLDMALTLDQVLNDTTDGIFALDRAYRCVFFSPACEHITGYLATEALGAVCRPHDSKDGTGSPEPSPIETLCPGLGALEGEVDSVCKQFRIHREDGSSVSLQGRYLALRDERARLRGVLGILRAQAPSELSDEQLRAISKAFPAELERLRGETRANFGFSNIVSTSPRMHDALKRIRAACNHPGAVLLTGEMGTGKQTVARTIHLNGPRRGARFVTVHCAEPKKQLDRELFGDGDLDGLIRAADAGTLYLESIGEMPPATQARFRHVLETRRVRTLDNRREHPVDLRIIVSDRRALSEAVSAGRFQTDLYHLISVITIHLPPLRERKEDIPYLVHQHLAEISDGSKYRRINTVETEVWHWLSRYSWPGNLRELDRVIETAYAIGSGEVLRADDLPNVIRGELLQLDDAGGRLDQPLDVVLASVERRAILAALRRAEGQRSRAAREMGISRSRLYRRMEALGIHPGGAS